MRTTVISAQNPGQADEPLNLPALVEHILEGAKLRLASWKSLTIAEIDLSLDRGVPRSLDEREPGIDWQNPDDELCEIVKDGAPFLHSGFDRGEVVVGQNHVGRLLRDVSAGDVHRHAHFDLFERGCVVDTIADHRDHIPAGLKCKRQP